MGDLRSLAGLAVEVEERLAALPVEERAAWLCDLARRLSDRLPPADALRFLFRLDARLYTVQGFKAVEYGGGLHPKHRHIRYHDFFVARIGAGERVLDVGCGNGAVAADVAERAGAWVTGVDRDEAAIREAREKHAHPRVTYVVGDALGEMPDGPFDAVILSNVLEHLAERPLFLMRLCEATGAARYLVRVPLLEREWRVPLKRELGVEWRLDPGHETEYTPETLASELSEAELTIVHQEFRWGEIWAEAHAIRRSAL